MSREKSLTKVIFHVYLCHAQSNGSTEFPAHFFGDLAMMKKFTVLAFAFATLAGLTGCQYLKGDPPAAPAPTAASAPQMVLVCDGKTKAVPPGTTIIKCGGQAAKPASRPASDNSAVIAELREMNRTLTETVRSLKQAATPAVAAAPAAGTPTAARSLSAAPAYAEDGKVYADEGGNTYERHKAGDKLCNFFVQGQLRKQVFVHGTDPVAAKKACDIEGQVFQASLTAITPEVKVVAKPN